MQEIYKRDLYTMRKTNKRDLNIIKETCKRNIKGVCSRSTPVASRAGKKPMSKLTCIYSKRPIKEI